MKELYEAINTAARAMPSLRKGDRNQHGGYNFVSIDDFYEKAASVAHQHGIAWTVREMDADIVEVGEKVDSRSGHVLTVHAMKIKYEIDVFHDSGACIRSFFSASILHPLQGAQTAGSAMSYVSKLFMRSVFTIVTGEGDADTTDSSAFAFGDVPSKPAPQVRTSKSSGPGDAKGSTAPRSADDGKREAVAGGKSGEADASRLSVPESTDSVSFVEFVKAFLPLAKTVQELTRYWVDNEKLFKQVEVEFPEDYAALIAMFAARKKELA